VRAAGALARSHDAELHVVHAWALVEEALLRGLETEAELRAQRLGARRRARRAVDELLAASGVAVPDDRIHLRKGHPTRVLQQAVHDQPASVLVMGAQRRCLLYRLFFGRRFDRVLGRVACSILAIKG
jgi:nucleotide-binding universal stress UspA family protein